VEVKKQPEECDRIVRKANSIGSWVTKITRNKDADELSGEPVGKFSSRGKPGQWERVLSFEAPHGKDTGDRSSSDDTAPKKTWDIF